MDQLKRNSKLHFTLQDRNGREFIQFTVLENDQTVQRFKYERLKMNTDTYNDVFLKFSSQWR